MLSWWRLCVWTQFKNSFATFSSDYMKLFATFSGTLVKIFNRINVCIRSNLIIIGFIYKWGGQSASLMAALKQECLWPISVITVIMAGHQGGRVLCCLI